MLKTWGIVAACLLGVVLALFLVYTVHGTLFLADHSSPINQNSTFTAAEEGFIDAAFAKHEQDVQNLSEFLQIKIYEGGQIHKKFIETNDNYISSTIWKPDGTISDTEFLNFLDRNGIELKFLDKLQREEVSHNAKGSHNNPR